MNDIMKIVQSLKESDLLIKDVRETIRNEAKEEKAGFPSMLWGTLAAILLGNLFNRQASNESRWRNNYRRLGF